MGCSEENRPRVGVLQVELQIPGSASLKEKRMVLKSLKDRIRQRFNVSVAEVAEHDKWQKAILGVASVGSDKRYVNGTLSRVVDLIKSSRSVELVDYQMELW